MNLKLLLLPVYREEGWHSIDLCTEMLKQGLSSSIVTPARWQMLEPPFRSHFQQIPIKGLLRLRYNADRLLNRFYDYPRFVRRQCPQFDLFHICDHSYAQLALGLPQGRVGIMCQDIDVFRSLLEPASEPRPWWYRQMIKRILAGFKQAALVFHTTDHVRSQLLEFDLAPEDRLVHAPLGVAPEFLKSMTVDVRCLPEGITQPYLLHVGSCIARKRVDVLLKVFAGVRAMRPAVRLVKVGGPWDDSQQRLIREFGLADGITMLQGISRMTLSHLYQHAAVTLVPSEREGFGLPVIEALACGSPVLANDIPPLREGGGTAAQYQSIDRQEAWIRECLRLIDRPESAPPETERRRQGQSFSWQRHASSVASAYEQLYERLQLAPAPKA